MGLPWVRLDSGIPTHDKIVHLMGDPSSKRYQAAASYMFALAWAGGAGTDGDVPKGALPFIHGSEPCARLLVKYDLWNETATGYLIRNFDSRQELSIVSESKRAAQRAGAIKGNCLRHHGKDCGCWREQLGERNA